MRLKRQSKIIRAHALKDIVIRAHALKDVGIRAHALKDVVRTRMALTYTNSLRPHTHTLVA
jgi:hypothetical protein